MKENNRLFQNLKQWCLKVSVSSIIFISVVLLGGAIITLALPSSLDEVKSTNAHYQLTADNWDYLVEQVKSGIVNLTNLSGKISTNITNIANLSGRLTTVSSTINSLRKKMGDTIYYTSGNVGIGITAPSDKLHVDGNIIANGGIKIGATAAICTTSMAGTLKYTEGSLSYCNGSEWKNVLREEVISNPLCGNAGIEHVGSDFIIRDGSCGGYMIADKNVGASIAGYGSSSYGNYYVLTEALILCPFGYHLPSADEWAGLLYTLKNIYGFNGANSRRDILNGTTLHGTVDGKSFSNVLVQNLLLPYAGRYAEKNNGFGTGVIYATTYGDYRSSTIYPQRYTDNVYDEQGGIAKYLHFHSNWIQVSGGGVQNKRSVRCFKD